MKLLDALLTKLAGTSYGMGPVTHRRVDETRAVPVPMRDGVTLLTDLFQPAGATGLPVLLLRTPYGRRQLRGMIERALAQRGYQVVSQSCRGTFGSGGDFVPFQTDAEDGVDTLKWLATQPWYSGHVVMYGLSYPGYVQLALAADAPAGMLSGLVVQNAASRVYDVFRPQGTVGLSNALNWAYLQTYLQSGDSLLKILPSLVLRKRRVAKAFAHLPQTEADTVATGQRFEFFQQVMASPRPDDSLWRPTDHSATVGRIDVPIHFIGGWFDFFLDPMLRDYAALVAAGKQPFLTIGPWLHKPTLVGMQLAYGEAFRWFRAMTTGDRSSLRPKPVRIQLLGTRQWLDLDVWPPAAQERQLFLQPAGQLAPSAPDRDAAPSTYTYDPADPTPSAGSAGLLYGEGASQVDNRQLERRPDVLTFTSEPLTEAIDVVGFPRLRLYARTTAPTTDFFVRLCDVAADGKSLNVTEGIVRWPMCDHELLADGVLALEVALSGTACRFEPGHRIRLQVSSGSHPRFGRNLGVDDPAAGPGDIQVAAQEVFHDPDHASELVLPILVVQPV
jgi:putative CocE/NonD family hydrolase